MPAKAEPKSKIIDFHQLIIDEYFSNGFNAVNAALKIRPELTYSSAASLGALVMKAERNRAYIEKKRAEITQEAQIGAYQIAQELKLIAFNDITKYIGLSLEEIKELTPEDRRAIKRITLKEKEYRYKDGSSATEKTLVIDSHDKLNALQELGKIIGIYEADNRQKANNINLTKLDVGTLNAILQAVDPPKDNHQ